MTVVGYTCHFQNTSPISCITKTSSESSYAWSVWTTLLRPSGVGCTVKSQANGRHRPLLGGQERRVRLSHKVQVALQPWSTASTYGSKAAVPYKTTGWRHASQSPPPHANSPIPLKLNVPGFSAFPVYRLERRWAEKRYI